MVEINKLLFSKMEFITPMFKYRPVGYFKSVVPRTGKSYHRVNILLLSEFYVYV